MTRPRWNGKRIDKEIGIMSARSAQRTRWRRWRMGRDIAGRKDRDGRMGGCEAQIVGGVTSLRFGGQLLLLLFPPFALRHVEVLPALLFPILSVSTACIGFRFGSAASFHFPDHVGLGFRTSDWRQQQNKPLPGLLMKQISLFVHKNLLSIMSRAQFPGL